MKHLTPSLLCFAFICFTSVDGFCQSPKAKFTQAQRAYSAIIRSQVSADAQLVRQGAKGNASVLQQAHVEEELVSSSVPDSTAVQDVVKTVRQAYENSPTNTKGSPPSSLQLLLPSGENAQSIAKDLYI